MAAGNLRTLGVLIARRPNQERWPPVAVPSIGGPALVVKAAKKIQGNSQEKRNCFGKTRGVAQTRLAAKFVG
jgi:hypothetical protein